VSTVGIVALSLLAGLFIALLIGVSGWLLWVGLQFRKTVAATSATLSAHRQEWSTTLESLRSTLETHRTQFDAQIKSIGGRQIEAAVTQLVQLVKEERIAAQRIERAAIAVGTFTQQWLSEGVREDTEITEVTPEGYAASAPGERFIGRSRVSLEDAAALEAESAEVTSADQP
jgi:hypothetical protein